MRIGIIAEGTTDQAIITNILMGLGFEYADIIFIRPDLTTDETDKNYENEATIGTWQGVKNACISRDEFEQFYAIADNRYIIIQLDSAEADQPDFNVKRPQKSRNENYATELRQLIIEKVNEWLNFQYTEKLLYAICIEEMEAWVLTIYQDVETTKSADPKTRLRNELSRKKIERL